MEIWKQIPDSNFEVSNLGRIRSFRILEPTPTKHGYLKIGFFLKAKRFHRLAHQLVALGFHGPCPKGMEVNHIDGNKRNNRPENLEYVTRKENAANALSRNAYRRGQNHPKKKTSLAQEKAIREAYLKGRLGMREVGFRYGVSKATVSRIVKGV
jgi:hypothetical protein